MARATMYAFMMPPELLRFCRFSRLLHFAHAMRFFSLTLRRGAIHAYAAAARAFALLRRRSNLAVVARSLLTRWRTAC